MRTQNGRKKWQNTYGGLCLIAFSILAIKYPSGNADMLRAAAAAAGFTCISLLSAKMFEFAILRKYYRPMRSPTECTKRNDRIFGIGSRFPFEPAT